MGGERKGGLIEQLDWVGGWVGGWERYLVHGLGKGLEEAVVLLEEGEDRAQHPLLGAKEQTRGGGGGGWVGGRIFSSSLLLLCCLFLVAALGGFFAAGLWVGGWGRIVSNRGGKIRDARESTHPTIESSSAFEPPLLPLSTHPPTYLLLPSSSSFGRLHDQGASHEAVDELPQVELTGGGKTVPLLVRGCLGILLELFGWVGGWVGG